MRVMLLGAGAVGEGYAVLTAKADPHGRWLEKLVIADFNLKRAREVCRRVDGGDRFIATQVDAGDRDRIAEVARENDIDLILNGCPQSFDKPIFDAAFTAGCDYLDMAMSLSEKHPKEPFRKTGVMLGDYQFARHKDWDEKGRLALLGMGIDPGVSEVFAVYAADHLFDTIDEIGIRDGSDIILPESPYATGFSVWSVIEECLNPPVFWEKEKGHYTGDPMSDPEVFDFPGGIGPLEVVAIEHEEVINLPRWIDKGLKKVSFKISLGKELMEALKILNRMGLTQMDSGKGKGVTVAPRDVVEACLPDPAKVGPKMRGKICVGTWVKGTKDGRPREVYLYQVSDNEDCIRRFGCQAVAAQTAVGPAIATELLAKGIWKKTGVLPPEAFDPEPFMERMAAYGFPYDIRDSWSESTG